MLPVLTKRNTGPFYVYIAIQYVVPATAFQIADKFNKPLQMGIGSCQ